MDNDADNEGGETSLIRAGTENYLSVVKTPLRNSDTRMNTRDTKKNENPEPTASS